MRQTAGREDFLSPLTAEQEALFWAKVDKSGECWLWTGARKQGGYGRPKFSRRSYQAHRLAYELVTGPIPEGLVVMHTCDNPPCVNPAHLRIGTDRDNVIDCWTKGRATAIARGLAAYRIALTQRTHCKNGHPFDADNTGLVLTQRGKPGCVRVCRECRRIRSRQGYRRRKDRAA